MHTTTDMDSKLKDDFQVGTQEKFPIISAKAVKGEMGALRFAKEELKTANYPYKDTKEVFELFFKGVKDKILKAIPEGAHLVLMPSTTGKNILPLLLAEAIREAKPSVSIHNKDFSQIKPLHEMEGKNKKDYISRLEDPIRFAFSPTLLSDLKKASGPKMAIDDILSSAAQYKAMELQLKNAGIPLTGIVTLRASSMDFPKENALKQTLGKILPHVEETKKESFKKDFTQFFAGFPTNKLYRFDQNLNVFTDYAKVQSVIEKGAHQLKEPASGALAAAF